MKDITDDANSLTDLHSSGCWLLVTGLDTCLSIMNVLQAGLGDCKYRPCPLLVQYVDAGYLGKKAGRGVYNYKTSRSKF